MTTQDADRALAELYPDLIHGLEAGHGGPFAAGVMLEGKLVGRGTNTVLRDNDVTRHAEMNALSDAGRKLGRVHLDTLALVTSHLPCLMCWHAAKWARISDVYYVFDYGETESLFGFRGDARFLEDLGLGPEATGHDPAIRLHRAEGESIDRLYRRDLVALWSSTYRDRLGRYDI